VRRDFEGIRVDCQAYYEKEERDDAMWC
jgi:hypothetical protein